MPGCQGARMHGRRMMQDRGGMGGKTVDTKDPNPLTRIRRSTQVVDAPLPVSLAIRHRSPSGRRGGGKCRVKGCMEYSIQSINHG